MVSNLTADTLVFINKAQNKIADLATGVVTKKSNDVELAMELLNVVELLSGDYLSLTTDEINQIVEYYNTKAALNEIPYLEMIPYNTTVIIGSTSGGSGITITSVDELSDYVTKTKALINSHILQNKDTLKGDPGVDGQDGYTPQKGVDYVDGTDGQPGLPGKSSYQVWLDAGNVGNVSDYLLSLKGVSGNNGVDGVTPVLTIGDVTEGIAFDVNIRGTAQAPVLDFVLVRGNDGNIGPEGPVGPRGYGLDIEFRGTFADRSLRDDANTEIGDTYMVEELGHEYHGYAFFYNGEGAWSSPVRVLGDQGWSPVHGVSLVGNAAYLTLVDFVGGTGNKPINLNVTYYLGTMGYTTNIANAVDIRGPQGLQGVPGIQGKTGNTGASGYTPVKNVDYFDGLSAYGLAVQQGYTGTQVEWIASLKGDTGDTGPAGPSAYQAWLNLGNTGTEQDFIDSLKGQDGTYGIDGKSAYELALDNGYVGTEAEWLLSLRGADGVDGVDGQDGASDWDSISNKPNFSALYEKKIARQSAIPSDTTVLWVDTTAIPATFKYWDGDSWELVGGASNFGQTQADARYLQLTGGTISGPVTFEYPEAGQTTVGMKFKLMNSAITGLYASVQGTDKPILTTSSSANGTQLWAGATKVIDMLSSRITLIKSVFIGGESTPTAQLHVQGASNTSGSKTFRFQNLANSQYFEMTDDGVIKGSNKLNALGGLQENSVDLSAKYRQLSVAIQITDINPAHLVNVYDLPATEIAKLEDNTKWTGNRYTGEPIVNTYQVQEYDSEVTGYWYKCTADNKWIRR